MFPLLNHERCVKPRCKVDTFNEKCTPIKSMGECRDTHTLCETLAFRKVLLFEEGYREWDHHIECSRTKVKWRMRWTLYGACLCVLFSDKMSMTLSAFAMQCIVLHVNHFIIGHLSFETKQQINKKNVTFSPFPYLSLCIGREREHVVVWAMSSRAWLNPRITNGTWKHFIALIKHENVKYVVIKNACKSHKYDIVLH